MKEKVKFLVKCKITLIKYIREGRREREKKEEEFIH